VLASKLTRLRDQATSDAGFRELVRELAGLLRVEAARGLALHEVDVETPIERTKALVTRSLRDSLLEVGLH